MVQWIAYSLIADSACSLLISLTSQLQKTGATDGSRYLFLALAVWAKAAPIFGRFLFFGHSSVACWQLHWNNWVQVRSIICFKRQVCWAYNYYHYGYCFLLPTKRFEVVSWFECSCSGQTMSTRGNHNVNRLSISSRPELPGTSCSLRVKATCGILMSLRPGTAAIPKLLQVPSVTWCSSLIFLAPALVAWKLSPKCPPGQNLALPM